MPKRPITLGTVCHLAKQGGLDLTKFNKEFKMKSEQTTPSTGFNIMSATNLINTEYEPLQFVVDKILPTGLNLLAGRPKKGKSWLVLDWALCVALDKSWNGYEVKQGDVLYLALEDNFRRLQNRLDLLGYNAGELPSLKFATQSPKMGKEFANAVKNWIDQSDNPAMLVIDPYGKIKPAKKSSGDDYEREYEILALLQSIAVEYDIAVVLVYHQKKGETEDPYDSILGSTGIAGAVDTMVLLHGVNQGTVLMGKGRDIEEFEIVVDMQACRWVPLGAPAEVFQADTRKKILEALGDELFSPKEVSEKLGEKSDNIRQTMLRMATDGELVKEGRGKYKKAPTIH